MKHITLLNGAIIRNEKQAAAEFFTVHASHEVTKNDLATLKSVIKENDGFAWFKYGVSLTVKTTERFNKDKAISLLSELGATEEQIIDCYVAISAKTVSKAK